MLRRAMAPILLLLWCLEIVSIAWPLPILAVMGGVLAAGFVVLALLTARRSIVVLCLSLLGVAAALAAVTGRWDAVPEALMASTVFAPFLVSIVLLRAVADLRPEIARARALFAAMPEGRRNGGFLVGAHVMGAVLNIGVLALIASIVGDRATPEARRVAAEATLRGLCLAPFWSPFWVAMAVAYQHVPGVPIWQVMGLGLCLAALGLTLAHILFGGGLGLASLGRAVAGLFPLVPPVAFSAALIALATSLTPLSAVQSLLVGIPLLCIGQLIIAGRGAVGPFWRGFYDGVGNVTGEVALLISATSLGRMMQPVLEAAGPDRLQAFAALGAPGLIVLFLFGGLAATLMGAHAVVVATVMLAIGAALDQVLAPLVLMQTALVAWGMSALVGLPSVTLALSSTLFGTLRGQLMFGPNLKFALLFSAAAAMLLSALNHALI